MTAQTVVISGGSSGIGLDLAKAYAKQGANLVLMARNQQRLDTAVKDCQQVAGSASQTILAYSVDVADQTQLDACVANIKEQVNVPDILILSAGIVASEHFLEQSDQGFDDIYQINVLGSRAVARAFLPDMVNNGKGQLCFVGSLGGLISTYGYSAYSASKFAVVGMAGALRQELHASGVGVSVLCPPEVDTPMVANEAHNILPQTRFIKDVGGTLKVETVTQSALKGIQKNKFMIVPGVMAKVTYWQARCFPKTSAWVMQKLVNYASKKVA
jgi:short-subunit dehydrogenase